LGEDGEDAGCTVYAGCDDSFENYRCEFVGNANVLCVVTVFQVCLQAIDRCQVLESEGRREGVWVMRGSEGTRPVMVGDEVEDGCRSAEKNGTLLPGCRSRIGGGNSSSVVLCGGRGELGCGRCL